MNIAVYLPPRTARHLLDSHGYGNGASVGSFSDNHLSGQRLRLRFEFIARLSGAIRRPRFHGIVADVIDRPTGGSPHVQQRGDVLLRLRIVPFAPARVIDRFLQIDHQQRGVRRRQEIALHIKLRYVSYAAFQASLGPGSITRVGKERRTTPLASSNPDNSPAPIA